MGGVRAVGAGVLALAAATFSGCSVVVDDSTEISSRVLDSVAIVDASSLVGQESVLRQLHGMEAAQTYACLKDAGREDLRAAVDQEFEESLGIRYGQFPDVDRLRATGFAPIGPESVEVEPAEEKLVQKCKDQPGGDVYPVEKLRSDLMASWFHIVDEEYTSSAIDAETSTFLRCLRDGGVPASGATSEMEFLAWSTGQHSRGASDARMQSWARLYADCGEPLFSARAERLKKRRPGFIKDHRGDLVRLTRMLST